MFTLDTELITEIVEQGVCKQTFDAFPEFLVSPVVVHWNFKPNWVTKKTEMNISVELNWEQVDNYTQLNDYVEFVNILQEAKEFAQMLQDNVDTIIAAYDAWNNSVKQVEDNRSPFKKYLEDTPALSNHDIVIAISDLSVKSKVSFLMKKTGMGIQIQRNARNMYTYYHHKDNGITFTKMDLIHYITQFQLLNVWKD